MAKPPSLKLPETETLDPDEMVGWLLEVNLAPPDYTTQHRYQVLQVIRNDEPHIFVNDMGITAKWPQPELSIYSFFQDSAQYIVEQAEAMRDDMWMKQYLAEMKGESTMNEDLVRLYHEQRKAKTRASDFGPLINVQRSF